MSVTFACTSAGKSYAATHDNPNGQRVDFDVMVAGFIGWPDVPEWWRDPELNKRVQTSSLRLLLAMAVLHPERDFMFNCDPSFVDVGRFNEAGVRLRVVLPSELTVCNNCDRKRLEQEAGRKVGQPTDYGTVLRSRSQWAEFARRHSIRTELKF